MNFFKVDSLENFLRTRLLIFSLPAMIFLALFEWQIELRWQWILISEITLFLIVLWGVSVIKYRVLRSYTRASLHLDAIRQEDYNQFAKSLFSQGKVREFHQQLNELSIHLQQQKSRYDQHIFLVYQLISQLDSPIIIFNKKQQLTFGNDAFYQLYNQPWQVYRSATPELLGLDCLADNTWHFKDESKNAKWQVRQSEFIEDGDTHYLLVFIDIESALRENQLNAWQQIIRVLSHEIRNSLTPVSSLAESLADKSLIERDKKVLNVITDRCHHLQSFVDRYSSISRQISLNRQKVDVTSLVNVLRKIFVDFTLNYESTVSHIWADLSFIEQVLINLIKNAKEAEASYVQLNFSEHEQHYIVEVIDDGHGFANLDNLFVPLYTTKTDGQGVGLSFCRNVVEQHGGALEIENNKKQGVTAMIILPLQPE